MIGVILVCMTVDVIANVRCESDSTSNDHSSVHGIAAKIGFPPTVLKVFIKGDIQAEEIEKLLNLCARDDKVPNDSDLTRNRRNSISDYIGKLYSFNNLFRPYRSIFRGFKHAQTTHTPWLKKFLRGVQEEPKTESFWGIALGAHTFSPFARPLAQTRLPYHRIRNQQRIDRLMGITRKYGNALALHHETKPYHWIRNHDKFDQLLGQSKSEETTTAINDQSQNETTRNAFHKAPLDVAGLRTPTFFPHLHAITTRRRLKFCEKQCADEPQKGRTIRPGSTGKPRPSSAAEQRSTSGDKNNTSAAEQNGSADECKTTAKCMCTLNACGDDYLCDGVEAERDCKGNGLNNDVSAVTKNVAQTKLTTLKVTTSKHTRSKESRPTGPVWTLPPNSVLDQAKTTDEQRKAFPATRVTPEDATVSMSATEYTTATQSPQPSGAYGTTPSSEHNAVETEVTTDTLQTTCKHGKPTKQMLCIPMPIPTRIRIPICPITRMSTRRCTRKTTTPTAEDICDCQSKKPPSEEIPISIGDSLEDLHKNPSDRNKGKPQKIIVRISSALGEVPVVIMRDNGVSGVSLSLVNDYLLDENNRLIKCLGQKPLSGRMDLKTLNTSARPVPLSKRYKSRHFIPHLLRQQLHGLQPKRYSFSIKYDPSQRLASRPRASLRTGNSIEIPNLALNHDAFSGSGISNQFQSYKLNSPHSQMNRLGSFGLQYPAIQNPGGYQSFNMEPPDSRSARLNPAGLPIPQMNLNGFPGNDISPTEYPRFKIHPGIAAPGRMILSGFETSGLNLQPAFPQQVADNSQLMGYGSPFLPLFYPNKNDVQPPKYMTGCLQ